MDFFSSRFFNAENRNNRNFRAVRRKAESAMKNLNDSPKIGMVGHYANDSTHVGLLPMIAPMWD